jgi:hypothetical protein
MPAALAFASVERIRDAFKMPKSERKRLEKRGITPVGVENGNENF